MDKLDALEVKKNCPANWNRMVGDEKVRHCTHCKHNVYNLTNMTREEAMELIEKTEGRLCTRFYRRKDGTIITKDCGFRESPMFWIGRLLLGGAALSVVMAIFTPVYAGAGSFSPKIERRALSKRISEWNSQILKEKDPELRKELLQLRQADYEELFKLYDRCKDDPSILEDKS
ncbi:MAG: hypothetical protein ABL949_04325 [Fimbriimonadaceae bacterium]